MAMTKEITLGSGKIYVKEYTEGEAINLDTLCAESNALGLISGGAKLSYSPTVYEVKDDLNIVYRKFVTAHTATLSSGILTWDVAALNRFISNGDCETLDKKTTLKIGGNGATEMSKWCVAFRHTKTDGSTITIGMVATSDNGIELQFAADKETVVDAEFSAVSHDDSGTLLIIEEVKA